MENSRQSINHSIKLLYDAFQEQRRSQNACLYNVVKLNIILVYISIGKLDLIIMLLVSLILLIQFAQGF